MSKLVDVANYGTFEFPDGMSDADMAAALDAHIASLQSQDQQPESEPGVAKRTLKSLAFAPVSFEQGLGTKIGDVASGGARLYDMTTQGDLLSGSPTAAPTTIRQERAAYEAAMKDPRYSWGIAQANGDPEKIKAVEDLLGKDAKLKMMRSSEEQRAQMAADEAKSRQLRLEQNPAYQWGQDQSKFSGEAFKVPEDIDQTFVTQLFKAAGGMAPDMVISAVPVVGPGLAATSYGLQTGEQQAQEAVDAGKPEAADLSFLTAAGLGMASERLIGVAPRFWQTVKASRIAGIAPETFGATVSKWAAANPGKMTALEGMLHEATQESVEQAGQNLIASQVAGYDPDRPTSQGVVQSGLLGGVLGGVAGGLGHYVGKSSQPTPAEQAGRYLKSTSQFYPLPNEAIQFGETQPKDMGGAFPVDVPVGIDPNQPNAVAQPLAEPQPQGTNEKEIQKEGLLNPQTGGASAPSASISSLQPTMESARAIAEMSPSEFAAAAPSFNRLNIEIGQNATPQDVAELSNLKARAEERASIALEQAMIDPSERNKSDALVLAQMPQFFNEALQASGYFKHSGRSASTGGAPSLVKIVGNGGPTESEQRSNFRGAPPSSTQIFHQVNVRSGWSGIPHLDPGISKPSGYGHVANPKFLADLPERSAIQIHGLHSLDIERQKMVVDKVVDLIHDHQVRDVIVQMVPVDVMNNLVGGKFSAEKFLHDPTMLKRRLSISPHHPASVSVAEFIDSLYTALPEKVAPPTTVLGGGDVRSPAAAFGSTVGAVEGDIRHNPNVSPSGYSSIPNASPAQLSVDSGVKSGNEVSNASQAIPTDEPSMADRIYVMALQRSLDARNGTDGGDLPQLRAATKSEIENLTGNLSKAGTAARRAEAFSQSFGKRVVWFASDADIKGAFLPQLDEVVFLNTRFADRAPELTVAHEISHAMKAEAPELWTELESYLRTRIANDAEVRKILTEDYSSNEVQDELVANAVEVSLSDSDVFTKVMGEKVSLWKKVLKFISDAWNSVANLLVPGGKPSVNQYLIRFTNPKEVSRSIAKAFHSYKNRVDVGLTNPSPEGDSAKLSILPNTTSGWNQMMADPNLDASNRERLDTLRKVQSGDIPADTRELIIKRVYTKPANGAGRVARGHLKKVADIISASGVPVNFNTLTDPNQRGEAGMIVVGRHLIFNTELAKMQAAALNAESQMELLAKGQSKVPAYKLGLAMLNAMGVSLEKDYKTYLRNLVRNGSVNANLAAQAAATLRQASQQAGGWVVSPGAIESAIKAIAENPNIRTDMDTAGIIRQMWDKGGRTGVSPETSLALFGDPQQGLTVHGLPGLLSKVKNLPAVLNALREISAGSTKAEAEIKAFQAAFNPSGRAVSPKDAMRRYAKLQSLSKMADTFLKTQDKNWQRGSDNLLGTLEALSLMHEMMESPQYKEAVRNASDALGVDLAGFLNSTEGEFRTLGPYPEQQHDYIISRMPTAETQAHNLNEITKLRADIAQYLADPNADPLKQATWKRIDDVLTRQWIENVSNPLKSGAKDPLDIKNFLPLQVTRTSMGLYRDMLAGPENLDLLQSLSTTDALVDAVRRLDLHPDHGLKAITLAIAKGAESHDFKIKNNATTAEQYRRWILNPLGASLQHYGAQPLRVGSFIPGTSFTVTAEDMVAVKKLHDFEQSIRKLSEHDMKVYGMPTQIADEFKGTKFFRESTTTGPMMLTRFWDDTLANWVRDTDNWRTGVVGDLRKAQVANLLNTVWSDPQMFRDVILGYIRETNPEFSRNKEFDSDFRALTAKAALSPIAIENFNDIVDAIAPLRKESREELEVKLKQVLDSEVVRMFDNFAGEVARDADIKDKSAIDKSSYTSLRTQGSFLSPRGKMLVPSTFYTYAKIAHSDLSKPSAVAITISQARTVEKMEALFQAYLKLQDNLKKKMDELTSREVNPLSRRQARNEIDKMAELGEVRYNLSMLNRRIEQQRSELAKRRDLLNRMDETFAPAVGKTIRMLNRSITSQLLANFSAIWNNTFGGTINNSIVVNTLLGRNRGILSAPFNTLHQIYKVALTHSINTIAKANPKLAETARHILPFADKISAGAAKNSIALQKAAEWLNTPYDWKNKVAAKKAVGFGGEILKPDTEVPAHLGLAQWLFSSRAFMAQDLMFPRWFDLRINEVNLLATQDILRDLFSRAGDIGKVRTMNGEKLDPTNPQQFISEKELESTKEQTDELRRLLSPIGSLESLMFDYYNRVEAAKAAGQNAGDVPIASPDVEKAIMLEFAKLGNKILDSNAPTFWRGNWIRQVLGTFSGWPSNFVDQVAKIVPRNATDYKRGSRFLLAASMLTFAMLLSNEWKAWLVAFFTGKEPGQASLLNVAQDPNLEDSTKLVVRALVSGVPYLNTIASSATDPSSMFDFSRMSPMLSWAKDVTGMGITAAKTGDVTKAFIDYTSRYMPLYSTVASGLPGFRENLQAGNTARVLRAATPSDIETRTYSGGGAGNQTALSRYLRSAESAAYAGNTSGIHSAIEQAIQFKMRSGLSRNDAESSIRQSLSARSPERRVFGRNLATGERQRIVGRMTGRQLKSYNLGMDAYQRLTDAVPKATAKTSGRIFKGFAIKKRKDGRVLRAV